MRGGSVGVRARVPEPAGGVVQSGDGGAEKNSFRLVSDCKAVNEQVEKSPGVTPNQAADMVDLLTARFLVSWTSSKATGRCLWRRRRVRFLRPLLRLACSPPHAYLKES